MVQYTWKQPPAWWNQNDFLFSDARNALWKALTIQGIDTIELGNTFLIYGYPFTVTGIEAGEQILLEDQYGRAWTVPAWPWTAAGT